MSLLIYAKAPGDKKFKAMDMSRGVQVTNLIYASNFPKERRGYLDNLCLEMECDNPGWGFEVRQVNNGMFP